MPVQAPKRAPVPRLRRRLLQLLLSLAVFLAVFLGRGLLPGQSSFLRTALSADADFKAVFALLGENLLPRDTRPVFFPASDHPPLP